MNGFFKEIKEDKILFRGSVLSVTTIFLSIFFIILYYGSLPPLIPLFNQMPWGEDRITQTNFIFLIPTIALLIFVTNAVFAKLIYKKTPLISRLFSMTSFLISVLSLLFIIRTINAVL